MTTEEMAGLREKYGREGYRFLDEEDWLSFEHPGGRFMVSYNKSTGKFFAVDGHWVVNLKETGAVDEVRVV